MEEFIAIACGVACGVVAVAPLLRALGRPDVNIGYGFGSVIGAFLALQVAMFVVLRVWPGLLAPFGISATLSFLACVVIAVLRRGA